MADTDYDVLIAGGGMVGISLALCLHGSSGGALRIAVVESFPLPADSAQSAPTYRPSFDARSTALSFGSRQIYERLGVWPQLSQHCCDISKIQVSDRGHFGSVLMDAAQQGWPALGYVVENPWLGSVLLSALRQTDIRFIASSTVDDVSPETDAVRVNVNQGESQVQLCTELLVVADGADSGLRAKLGIHARVEDYHQCAFIANVATDMPHREMAFERFTEVGPLAMLPLPADGSGLSRSALVWTFDAGRQGEVEAWDDAQFLAELQRQFGYRLGRMCSVGTRAVYPLQLVAADEQIRRQVVVMGNAAHFLHPVAGQGFNLALRDADSLSRILAGAKQNGVNLGELAVLQRYVDHQGSDQWFTTLFSDQLTRIFGNRNPALSLVRNLGLLTLDSAPVLKNRFTARAAGMVAPATARRGAEL